MSTYYKVLLFIIVLAYAVSPIDLIPDIFIPYIGWIDDTFLMWLLAYYLRFGRLPDFFSRGKTQASNTKNSNSEKKASNGKNRRSDNQTAGSDNATSSLKSPEEVLGVRKGAPKEEIQAAYRRAVKAYHPDRVANLGLELQELANEKFLEIKKAYDTLMNA